MHGVLGGIGVLERHAASCSQRCAAHHQAVVVLEPLEHPGVEGLGGGERCAGDMDVLQLAVVVETQVGDLHTEGRDAVAVAALPLGDADVRFRAGGCGSSQLPVHVGLGLWVLHRDSRYSTHGGGDARVEGEEEESAEPQGNPNSGGGGGRHSGALESSMQEILTATLEAAQ